jgi:hypothetical protein
MGWTTGSYADSGRPATLRSRLFWLRTNITGFWLAHRRHPEDTGAGTVMYREWGAWVVRPCRGWRQWRWITPPLHATRSIPAAQRDAALDWWMGTAQD